MIVRNLVTDGTGSFRNSTIDLGELPPNKILIKTKLTGICRSDVDMMTGKFQLLPESMHGHEGLGEIIAIGEDLETDLVIGDIVATRGEPAYADYYYADEEYCVKVPSVDPVFILEPVACAINLIEQFNNEIMQHMRHRVECNAVIVGSGFLAMCTALYLRDLGDFPIDVVGSSNTLLWEEISSQTPRISVHPDIPAEKKYSLVIDLSARDIFSLDIFKPCAKIIEGVNKNTSSDFSNIQWNACSVYFPSPRSESFSESMRLALELVKANEPIIKQFWTHSYNRDLEWPSAFSDALVRNKTYSRGYLEWTRNISY